MIKRLFALSMAAAVLALPPVAGGNARSVAGFPHLAAAVVHSCDLKGVADAKCGTYEVFENRSLKAGRKIGLNIVVLPALDGEHSAEPVFWLSGGPGDGATHSVGAANGGFLESLRTRHDLVFVDQRGTGDSNGLFCDIGDDPRQLGRFFGELFPLKAIKACRKSLDKVADLRFYTTAVAMDDLDQVRSSLGYDKINLVGASYGSLAAQVYMRQHPEHVRAVFLLGVATPAIKQPLLFAPAAQHSLELLFADCAADTLCATAFPNFQHEFDAVLKRFERRALRVGMIDPVSRKRTVVTLPRANYVEQLRLMTYSTGKSRFLPMIVHHAYQNDFIPFEEMAAGLNGGGDAFARGMYFTVTCTEGVPFITRRDLVEQSRGTFVGEQRTRAHIAACKEWARGEDPPNFTALVHSKIPVLMISGVEDGSTPPHFGEDAMKNFPNGRQIKILNYGHQLDSPCVWQLMQTFIERGSARDLDVSCVAQVRRPPFATEVPAAFAIK